MLGLAPMEIQLTLQRRAVGDLFFGPYLSSSRRTVWKLLDSGKLQ